MKKGFKDFSCESFLQQQQHDQDLYDIFLEYEKELTKKSEEYILTIFRHRITVMKKAISESLENPRETMGNMGGRIAYDLKESFFDEKKFVVGELGRKAALYAIATNESNACMSCIVACPTAGGSGVVPGTLLAAQEFFKFSDEDLLKGYFVASGIGAMIAHKSTLSGAEGGCQAEVGSGVAMAAAGLTYIRGGNSEQCFEAATLGLKNLLGLACDPIGGLVEVPCIKRNAFGTQFSLLASDLSLSGVKSFVPFDEVVETMKKIGDMLPLEIKETARGGLATTPTGLKVNQKLGLNFT